MKVPVETAIRWDEYERERLRVRGELCPQCENEAVPGPDHPEGATREYTDNNLIARIVREYESHQSAYDKDLRILQKRWEQAEGLARALSGHHREGRHKEKKEQDCPLCKVERSGDRK